MGTGLNILFRCIWKEGWTIGRILIHIPPPHLHTHCPVLLEKWAPGKHPRLVGIHRRAQFQSSGRCKSCWIRACADNGQLKKTQEGKGQEWSEQTSFSFALPCEISWAEKLWLSQGPLEQLCGSASKSISLAAAHHAGFQAVCTDARWLVYRDSNPNTFNRTGHLQPLSKSTHCSELWRRHPH